LDAPLGDKIGTCDLQDGWFIPPDPSSTLLAALNAANDDLHQFDSLRKLKRRAAIVPGELLRVILL